MDFPGLSTEDFVQLAVGEGPNVGAPEFAPSDNEEQGAVPADRSGSNPRQSSVANLTQP
jgi:hypothetical protein